MIAAMRGIKREIDRVALLRQVERRRRKLGVSQATLARWLGVRTRMMSHYLHLDFLPPLKRIWRMLVCLHECEQGKRTYVKNQHPRKRSFILEASVCDRACLRQGILKYEVCEHDAQV